MNLHLPSWGEWLAATTDVAHRAAVHVVATDTVAGRATLALVVVLVALTAGTYAAKLGVTADGPILTETERG